jgi:hypothetical protein
MCEELEIPVPPIILCNEKYDDSKKGYNSNIDTDILYIDIKEEDYLAALLRELGRYLDMDELTCLEFVELNRERFPRVFSSMVMA